MACLALLQIQLENSEGAADTLKQIIEFIDLQK